MLQLLNSVMIMLSQTASEKKLTVMYLLLFFLFLMLLLIDARTKKEYVSSKIVKNTVLFLIFLVAVGLLLAYLRL